MDNIIKKTLRLIFFIINPMAWLFLFVDILEWAFSNKTWKEYQKQQKELSSYWSNF